VNHESSEECNSLEVHREMGHPLVSIIITSYNYGHYLAEAIESALKQTYPNIEIIVVDDGSTDNTKNIAQHCPVHYFYQTHQGVAIARNNGIKLANGEFFISLDADDKLVPEHIRETVRLMMKDPNIGFVLTGSKIWNEERRTENIWIPRKIYHKYSLFAGWRGALGSALFRRIAFDSLQYGFDSALPAYEDLDLCFRLLLKGWKTSAILEPLHWYRVHKGSLSPKTSQQRKYAESVIDRKYWFRKPYRRLNGLYENTLGRTASLIVHPIEYLKGIKKKTKIKVWMRSNNWVNSINQEKAQELTQEFFFTVDMLVERCQNKDLRNYYIKQLKIFESQMLNIISSNAKKETLE
jgi:glycosyltransferase involved in cell wall biosynthesis